MSLEGLLAQPAVRAVAGALEGCAWLVGGSVRDALLDRPLKDLDVVVGDEPEHAARAIGRILRGPVFQLSEEFGAWRAIDPETRLTVDVSAMRGDTLEADLAQRDFTVNAIGLPIGGGEPIDPQGGIADIESHRLRVLGATAYDEDPLRALRLIRFVGELGFEPDAQTVRLTEAAAARLGEPAAERVFAELRLAIASSGALQALALGRRTGVLEVVLPELAALEGIDQSRFHHLDVYDHTLEVLARTIELTGDPGSVFGELAPQLAGIFAEPLADELTRGEALRLGALFHDIAKPHTRGERDDGRVTFIGHDAVGDQMVGQILRRLKTSERLRAYVGKLTREHLVLGFMMDELPLSLRAVHGYLRRCDPVEVEVTVLSCADRMATRGEGQRPWIERHLELACSVMKPALRWRVEGPPAPILRGDELAAALSIEPGPELGRLLSELETATYAGEVADRDQALELVRRIREDRER